MIGIKTNELPELESPVLIAGFNGWGNALDISKSTAEHLVSVFNAEAFATLDCDEFFRYDDVRPVVNILGGRLKSFAPPGGTFYYAKTSEGEPDLVILVSHEPNCKWQMFTDSLFDLANSLKASMVITLGSMFDNVLHTDRVISGIASSDELMEVLKRKKITPVFYQGPSAIHAMIQTEGEKKGIPCLSLWAHSPYYVQGFIHYGLLSGMSRLLGDICGFAIDTDELEESWLDMEDNIQKVIDDDPELTALISRFTESKTVTARKNLKQAINPDDKVIDLTEFLRLD